MASPPPFDPLVGTVVDDRYRITARLGQGGMGTVYRCENKRLHARPCAMKVLSGLGTPRERARFEREIRTVSQLRSVHTVLVFDSGLLPDERPYIVMELLEGRELKVALTEEGPFTLDHAVRITDQVLTALIEAHTLGIVHRDLKPANLFLVAEGDGEISKVLDFGIAKQQDDGAPVLTRRDTSMGTPRYMSPEQFRNEDATTRSDLYALGVVFYEMVTGRLPFHEDDPVPATLTTMPPGARLAWMHLNREPPRIDGLSPTLTAWLTQMLCKDPAGRFTDARTAREALRGAPEMAWTPATGPTGRPTSITAPALVVEPAPTRRWAPMVGGVIGGLLALGGLIVALDEGPPPPAADAVDAMCTTEVESDPPGARVMRGSTLLGLTPQAVERPCESHWVIDLELEGHRSVRQTLSGPTRQGSMRVSLVEVVDAAPDVETSEGTVAEPRPQRRRRTKSRRAPRRSQPEARKAATTPPPPPPPAHGAEPLDPLPF